MSFIYYDNNGDSKMKKNPFKPSAENRNLRKGSLHYCSYFGIDLERGNCDNFNFDDNACDICKMFEESEGNKVAYSKKYKISNFNNNFLFPTLGAIFCVLLPILIGIRLIK